jgi:hypothetical protein
VNRFSDRMGITEPHVSLQTSGMSKELRNSIWNWLVQIIDDRWSQALHRMYLNYFRWLIDDLPDYPDGCRRELREYLMNADWYEVYNLAEYVIMDDYFSHSSNGMKGNMIETLNLVFAKEMSAYRIIGNFITPVSENSEVDSINDALDLSLSLGIDGARQHLVTSLSLLGRKPVPDYRNSIKESISAVESTLAWMNLEKSSNFDKDIDKLIKSVPVHPALRSGFSKLYAWTSDSDGVRHGMMDDPTVGFAEAKFMLVSCSAFIYFLVEKARQVGKLPQAT